MGRRRKSRLLKCAVENFAELSGGSGTVHKLAIDKHGWRATNVQGLAFFNRFLYGAVILGLHASLQLVLIHFEFSCFINRDAIKRGELIFQALLRIHNITVRVNVIGKVPIGVAAL